ncbi:MAG TPA: hypothetical protein VK605_07235 [Solirubrobacteraceae bacterium]|nr:hypothetical protein [Solirubrobacteraceae bacterium]
MEIVVVILAFALLGVVLFVVSGPLRADRVDGERGGDASRAQRADLEAAREAKYREIRDAELDLRTGKLSRADYDSIDGALRAEALQILDRLQALDASAAASPPEEELRPRDA